LEANCGFLQTVPPDGGMIQEKKQQGQMCLGVKVFEGRLCVRLRDRAVSRVLDGTIGQPI
jgi:hypothetical protein